MTRTRTRAEAAERAAVAFFYEHAGYSYMPGKEFALRAERLRGARALAAAERDARALGYRVGWENDPDGCGGCDCGSRRCACSTGADHRVEWAYVVLLHMGGESSTCPAEEHEHATGVSLGGICEATPQYRRVIEAELFQEVLVRA